MKVFIAGSRAVSSLDENVRARLTAVCSAGCTVLVGDARGTDRLVQLFCAERPYKNVVVYASNGDARNNVGKWPVAAVQVDRKTKGFAFYTAKDRKMAEDADYGFMIWDGKSRGTLNDSLYLTAQQKKVLVYFVPLKKFLCLKSQDDLSKFVAECDDSVKKTYEELLRSFVKSAAPPLPRLDAQHTCDQLSIFDG